LTFGRRGSAQIGLLIDLRYSNNGLEIDTVHSIQNDAPEPVRELLEHNLDAYLAGATGPDIAQTSYIVDEAFNWPHHGSASHTGNVIVRPSH